MFTPLQEELLRLQVQLVEMQEWINFDGYLAMELGFDRRDIEPDYVARRSFDYLKPLVDAVNVR